MHVDVSCYEDDGEVHTQASDLQYDAFGVDKFGWLCTKLRSCKTLLTAFEKNSHCVASQGRNDLNS